MQKLCRNWLNSRTLENAFKEYLKVISGADEITGLQENIITEISKENVQPST